MTVKGVHGIKMVENHWTRVIICGSSTFACHGWKGRHWTWSI